MSLQTSFDILSTVVEQYESRGQTVEHVEATASDTDGDSLDVRMDVPVSLCSASGSGVQSALTPETATLTRGSGLQVEFSTSALTALPPDTRSAVSTSEEGVHVVGDEIVLTVELTIDPSDTTEQDSEPVSEPDQTTETIPDEQERRSDTDQVADEGHTGTDLCEQLAATRDESLPPYEDTDYLERLYDACNTFTEMSEAIDMDVSSETVRRYMIEADVHDPTSYNTVSNATEQSGKAATDRGDSPSTESPQATDDPMDDIPDKQLVTDGLGLPADIRIEDIADAVVESLTVYEVQRNLDLERRQTHELLKQLNLIDLVTRQMADDPEEEVSYEEVAARIRQCAPV